MENTYKLASLVNRKEVIDNITSYEDDLKKKTGKEFVLIAYTKDAAE